MSLFCFKVAKSTLLSIALPLCVSISFTSSAFSEQKSATKAENEAQYQALLKQHDIDMSDMAADQKTEPKPKPKLQPKLEPQPLPNKNAMDAQ